jgi:hypothetical protein
MSGTAYSEIASDRVRDACPIVYLDDLAFEPSNPESAQQPWPEVGLSAFEKAIEAGAQGALLLQREIIDIAQRNINASFYLLRKLAGTNNLGEILDLQTAYWRNQFGALMGQAEEFRALSTKAVADMAEPILNDVRELSPTLGRRKSLAGSWRRLRAARSLRAEHTR